MGLPAEQLRELSTLAWSGQPQRYSVDRLYRTLGAHEDGDFRESSTLVRIMLRDARISSCLSTRVNALLGCVETLEAPDGHERRGKKVIKQISEWWWTVLDESARAQLYTWGVMAGIGIATCAWDLSPSSSTPSSVRVHSPDGLFWDASKRKLFYQWESGLAEEVIHGDGKWIVFAPYGYRSWTQGKVLSIADCWLMKHWTRRDFSRRIEWAGQGIVKGKTPAGASVADQDAWRDKLRRIGSSGVITCPQAKDGSGYDVERMEAKADGHDLFVSHIGQQNVDIAIALLGQNLTTEVGSPGTYGTTAHGKVRQDYLEWDARAEADCLRSGVIVVAVAQNEGDAALAPWPTRQTAPPEDEKAKADTLNVLADALTKLKKLEPSIDHLPILEKAGLTFLAPEQVAVQAPTAPANDGAEATPPVDDSAAAPAAARVKLAEGDDSNPAGPFVRGLVWTERLAIAAASLAPHAASALIAQALRAVNEATGYDDLRFRLADLADEAVDPTLERLIERSLVLAFGMGTDTVAQELDAGP